LFQLFHLQGLQLEKSVALPLYQNTALNIFAYLKFLHEVFLLTQKYDY